MPISLLEVMDAHKIIVNTTPLGMYPHVDECPDIPYGLLTSSHLCYDLLYNPDVTLFMKKSSDMGAETKTALRCYCSRRLCRGKSGRKRRSSSAYLLCRFQSVSVFYRMK